MIFSPEAERFGPRDSVQLSQIPSILGGFGLIRVEFRQFAVDLGQIASKRRRRRRKCCCGPTYLVAYALPILYLQALGICARPQGRTELKVLIMG